MSATVLFDKVARIADSTWVSVNWLDSYRSLWNFPERLNSKCLTVEGEQCLFPWLDDGVEFNVCKADKDQFLECVTMFALSQTNNDLEAVDQNECLTQGGCR